MFNINAVNSQNTTNSSDSIKELIAKKRAFNKKFGYGYTIQIYYGNETEARSAENKFRVNFSGVSTKLDYKQPYWKVLVGSYKTKLEADRALMKYSKKFSGLIVIPLGK
jgi:hypothetical protein